MANTPWCICKKDPTTKYSIPGVESLVCFQCLVNYITSIPYSSCPCWCHVSDFKKVATQSCGHCVSTKYRDQRLIMQSADWQRDRVTDALAKLSTNKPKK